MIPKTQFKRAVTRFEKATRALKRDSEDRPGVLAEFRAAKRELISLGNLLITGEPADKSYTPQYLPVVVKSDLNVWGEPRTSGR